MYFHNSKKNFIKNLKITLNEGPVHELYLCFRWLPVFVDKEQKLALMSIGFLVENEQDAIIWRGPKKTGVKHLDNKSKELNFYPTISFNQKKKKIRF